MIEIKEKLEDGTRLYGWKSEPPLTPVAPSYTHYITEKQIFTEEECEEWYKYLLEKESVLLDEFRTSAGDGSTGLGEYSLTSRYPYFNVLKFDFHLVPKLKKSIYDGIKTILSVVGDTDWKSTLYSNSWFNVMRQGEAMKIHFHGVHLNSFYGFHLTIGTRETFTSYYCPITYPFRFDAFHTPNKCGYLTLFPEFIPHSVSINKYTDIPRISIAGTNVPSTWFEYDHHTNNKESFVKLGNVG